MTQYICSICKGRIRVGQKQGGKTVYECVRCDKRKEVEPKTEVVEIKWED